MGPVGLTAAGRRVIGVPTLAKPPVGARWPRDHRRTGAEVTQLSARTRTRLRGPAEQLLAHSPLQAVALRRRPDALRVLAYHGVPSAQRFADQLDWLAAHTTVVSLDDARRHLLAGATLPSRPVLITFDDGDPTVLSTAVPLLQARGLPAVAFVIAGLVDTDTPFWWTEVEHLLRDRPRGTAASVVGELKMLPDGERRERIAQLRETDSGSRLATPQLTSADVRTLREGGVAIGNHSLTHPCLDRCDDRTLRREVEVARQRLHDILGEAPDTFAYPNGNVDARVEACVAAMGHDLAFAFDHRVVHDRPNPLRVSRIRVDSDAPMDRFRIRVSGLHPAFHAARGGR